MHDREGLRHRFAYETDPDHGSWPRVTRFVGTFYGLCPTEDQTGVDVADDPARAELQHTFAAR